MRAAALLLIAVMGNLSIGAPLGVRFLLKKKSETPAAGAGIVMKAPVPSIPESERVELDVRNTPEPIALPESSAPAQPKTKAAPAIAARPADPAPAVEPPFAALVSARVDELPMCRRGDAAGPGVAEVVFLPEGTAKVSLTEPYARTETGACVARRLGRDARPFDGAPVAVRARFSL